MRVEEQGVVLGPLKEEAIKENKEKARHRRDIIERVWRIFDLVGEQKIAKIEELEKELE